MDIVTVTVPRKELSLRLSVTDRCQLRCRYCMPESGVAWHSRDRILSYEEMERFVARLQDAYQIRKVRLTGGDPLLRKNIVHLIKLIAALHVPDISLTTNALALAPLAGKLADAGLNRVNISLDSLQPETYSHLTRGGSLAQALAGIQAALETGLAPVKLNMVVMRGINDSEIDTVLAFALEHNCELRFLELMPIGIAAEQFQKQFMASSEVMQRLQQTAALTPICGNCSQSSRDFDIKTAAGQSGRIGLISSNSAPFCSGCRRLRLTCTGALIGCLAAGETRSIRHLLKPDTENATVRLATEVEAALTNKKNVHTFEDRQPMIQVGG